MVNPTLAAFYGVSGGAGTGYSRVSLNTAASPRRGLLTQANFLATYVSNDTPIGRPVKRGKTLLNQVLCLAVQFPTDPNLAAKAMKPPAPSPNATTRQLAVQHSTEPACAGCHAIIDPMGFAFENFDAIGNYRTTENGRPIDASGTLRGTDVDGRPFSSAGEMVALLGQSDQVRRCFATNFFRFASAQSSDGTEAQYLDLWRALPADARTQIVQLLVAYVRSDMFVKRRST
jgi:hypothetical protein